MKLPRFLWRDLSRLFPPTARADNIHAPVAVNISNAHAVRIDAGLFRDLVDDPWRRWIRGIRLRIFQSAVASEKNFRLSVSVDILEQFNFSRRLRDYVITIPPARFALWVDVKINRPLIDHQNVGPAVACE